MHTLTYSHMDNLDAEIANLTLTNSGGGGDKEDANNDDNNNNCNEAMRDGPGKYKLVGFISHIGKNLGSGHYVCHILKEGRWCIFNDEKVAYSESPPFKHGYLYLFQRADAGADLSF